MRKGIKYGIFYAVMDGHDCCAEIAGQIPGGDPFSMVVHLGMMNDRALHEFDIVSETAWPDMGAHERSDLRVLVRILIDASRRWGSRRKGRKTEIIPGTVS